LRFRSEPKIKKVQEIVQIDLPVRLGVRGQWKIFARLFSCHIRRQPLVVHLPGVRLQFAFAFRKLGANVWRQIIAAPLTIASRL